MAGKEAITLVDFGGESQVKGKKGGIQ